MPVWSCGSVLWGQQHVLCGQLNQMLWGCPQLLLQQHVCDAWQRLCCCVAALSLQASRLVCSESGGHAVRKVWSAWNGSLVRKAEVHSAAQTTVRGILDSQLNDIRDSGTWKAERIIVTSQGPSIRVEGRPDPVLNFCANNYLGLSVSSYFADRSLIQH